MSDPNDPTPPTVRRKVSAFASTFESAGITAPDTYRDVQRIKPGLPREKAEKMSDDDMLLRVIEAWAYVSTARRKMIWMLIL
jgi:hypothetical protein